jgi:hypothetical protein
VPDQGFILSSDRTAHPLSVKLTTLIAGSALALGAAAAASSAPARPSALTAAATRPIAGRPATDRPPAPPRPPSIRLDTMLTPAAPAAARKLTPRQIARQMLGSFGWSQRQFPYLNWLWNRESGWNVYAENPYSGAYGIPQADPGAKMASAGPDWPGNATTQIRWGLRYIRSTYGSPRLAWDHEVADGWY